MIVAFRSKTFTQLYHPVYRRLYGAKVKFPRDFLELIKQAFAKYKSAYNKYDLISPLAATGQNNEDPIISNILECLVSLLFECNIVYIKPKSESHVQAATVHRVVRSLFKFGSTLNPHCSNKKVTSGEVRHDYTVEVYEPPTHINKYTNLLRELKPNNSAEEDISKTIKVI